MRFDALPSKGLIRTSTLLIAAAIVLAFTLQKSIVAVLRGKSPQAATRIDTTDARAAAGAAFAELVADPNQISRVELRARATNALVRDPTVVPAARTLGLLAEIDGDKDKARRIFHAAERLSARDLPTQLWLIEHEVSRNNVPGALQHFDTALRANRSAQSLLLPILVNAAADPALAPEIANRLLLRPNWSDAFLRLLLSKGNDPAGASTIVETLMRQRINVDDEIIWALVNRHVDKGDARSGWRVYSRRYPGSRPDELRNGRFASEQSPVPFDWWLSSESDISADRVDGEEGSGALAFQAANAVPGPLARQLVLMQPGDQYRLRGVVGELEQPARSRPFWRVRCMKSNRSIATVDLPAASDAPAPFSVGILVPNDCPVQMIELQARASDEVEGVRGLLLRVSLERMASIQR
jgi:hypothetical protein